MYRNDYDQMMKLLVIGDSSVGKTSLLKRFSEGTYSDNFIPTVGIDFAVKNMKIDNKIIKVQIFDTAGQERFKSIITSYFRNADGILIVYDVSDKKSLQNIQDYWLRDIKMNCTENVKLILVGNKSDVSKEKRQVTFDIGDNFAKQLNIVFIETSAKTEKNVAEAFEAIVKDIYYRKKIDEQPYITESQQQLKKQQQEQQTSDKNNCSC